MMLKLGTRYTTWCYGQTSRPYRQVTNIKRPHSKLKFLVLLKHFHIQTLSALLPLLSIFHNFQDQHINIERGIGG